MEQDSYLILRILTIASIVSISIIYANLRIDKEKDHKKSAKPSKPSGQ